MSTDSVADSVAAAVTRPDATDALISDEVKQQRQLEERLKQTETDLVAVEASLEAKADDLEKHTEAVAETQKQLRETKQQSNELMIQQRYLQSQIASHDATRMGHRNNLADTRVNLKYTDIKSLDRGLAELRSIKGKKDATAAEKKAAEREAMLLDAQRERVRAYQAHSTAENKSLEDASTTKKELEKLRKEITVLKRKETKLADKLGKNKSAVETEYNKLVKRRKKLTDTKRKIVQDLKNLQTEQTRIKRSEERKAKKAQKEQVKKEQGNDNAETKTDKTTKAATAAAPVAKKKSLYSVQKQNASILKTYLEGLKPKSSTPVAATPESKLVPAPSGRKSRNARFQGEIIFLST